MTDTAKHYQLPLISIIIPCYNHGRFIYETLTSIANVNYPHIETILIDDGSTDNTREIAGTFPWVNYKYQANSGLPASRNNGISMSRGEFLLFLDADDLLFPDGLSENAEMLMSDETLAFVSGCHNVIDINGTLLDDSSDVVEHDHYIEMLGRNYIGNPGTVLYRRRVFDEFRFDISPDIKGCEDYDLYLKITRKYPVRHHIKKVTAYRKHDSNMSGNFSMMHISVINVLKRQESFLRDEQEKLAWRSGMHNWKRKYAVKMLDKGWLHLKREERQLIFNNSSILLGHYWSAFKIKAGALIKTYIKK